MKNASNNLHARQDSAGDIAWRAVWSGFAIALAGTLVAGGAGLLFAAQGMWWVANCGMVSLFVGGLAAGLLARTAEPLNGAFIAAFYFGAVTFIVFAGEFFALLPDPLPGLPRGDSTFFFVWPLGQLAAGTLGAAAGGWIHARRGGRLAE